MKTISITDISLVLNKCLWNSTAADFLDHSIKIGQGVFVRHDENDLLLWNCRSAAGCLIENGSPLSDYLSRNSSSIRGIFNKIAAQVGCPSVVVENDYTPIIQDLVSIDLLSADGVVQNVLEDTSGMSAQSFQVRGLLNDSALNKFFSKRNLPIELHIDLTDECCEKCVHCYLPKKECRYIDKGLVFKVLCEFRKMHGLSVYLSGGECMMHPDFREICYKCRELDLNLIVMSNLVLCDCSMVRFMREIDPQFINVSLYSMDSSEHDAVTTIKGSWDKTIGAIKECRSAGVHIRIASPLLKANRNAFEKLRRFAAQNKMHLITEYEIIPKSNHDCSNLKYVCTADELEKTLMANKEVFDRGFGSRSMPQSDEHVCEIGTTRMYLNSSGHYYPCDGMHDYTIGNACEMTLAEVWRGEKLNELRALKNRDFGKCAFCEHRPFCKVCPAYNFNATGKLTETIPSKCELARVLHKVYGGV